MSARKRDREKVEKKDPKVSIRPLTPNKPTKKNTRIFGTVTTTDPTTGAPIGQSDPFGPPEEFG